MAFVDGTDCTAGGRFDRFFQSTNANLTMYEIRISNTATVMDAFRKSIRELAEAVSKSFPHDSFERAKASVRIAARLQPKQLSMGQFGGLKKFRRLARSACPARFAFYQGEFA